MAVEQIGQRSLAIKLLVSASSSSSTATTPPASSQLKLPRVERKSGHGTAESSDNSHSSDSSDIESDTTDIYVVRFKEKLSCQEQWKFY